MTIPIKTNELEVEINKDKLSEKYSIFKVDTSKAYFSNGAFVLDSPLLTGQVCSIYFATKKTFFILMERGKNNKRILKDILFTKAKEGDLTLEEINLMLIDCRIILSLLLNALGSYESKNLRFNNLTGHYYCFNPEWIQKDSKTNTIFKVACMEVSITDEMLLKIDVRTFSSVLLRNKIKFEERKFEDYPQYVLLPNKTLRRKLSDDKEKPTFILRQTIEDRTVLPFMNIRNIKSFEVTKMGVLTDLLSNFNEKYSGYCHLELHSITEYESLNLSNKIVKEDADTVHKRISEIGIQIVDCIGDKNSEHFCKKMKNVMEEKHGIHPVVGKQVSKDYMNVCLIHNKKFYENNKDTRDQYKNIIPHGYYKDMVIQHVTLEDFKNIPSTIMAVFHEVIIKHDIMCRRFSLYDWTSLGMESEIVFGLKENNRFAFMKIRPDGSFEFKEQNMDFSAINPYTECMKALYDYDNVVGCIMYADGNINIIRNTSWFTVPEIEKIHDELSKGNTHLRGEESRNELLSAITDIRLMKTDTGIYYFAGIIGKGMNYKIHNAVLIRKIEAYRSSKVRFSELLPLMSVSFVRNGQLTVIPFPFKYLREYIKNEN